MGGVFSRFDSAMQSASIKPVRGDPSIGEIPGFLLGGEGFDVRAQGPLIAFERQNVISLFGDDLGRDVALATHWHQW